MLATSMWRKANTLIFFSGVKEDQTRPSKASKQIESLSNWDENELAVKVLYAIVC